MDVLHATKREGPHARPAPQTARFNVARLDLMLHRQDEARASATTTKLHHLRCLPDASV